jgi:hypothetical protein
VRASKSLVLRSSQHLKYRSNVLRIPKLKFSLAIAVVLLGLSVVGSAQQTDFRVKKQPPEKAPRKVVPVGKTPGTATASGENAKDLQNLEHQTAHVTKPTGSATKRTGPALKPIKDKPNPPINFTGTNAKSPGMTTQSSNPYRGRLRQKHSHQ